jgi:uncharacterized membrane protein
MGRRMTVATLALIGVFVATYLTLYKLGMIGTLACGAGRCETVNASRWATFLGLPVAAWGVGFYMALFALALASTTERFADAPWMPLALVTLTGWGVVFSGWLTWLELFVIHAICQWCVVSACLVTLTFVVSVWDWRARQAPR